MPVRDSQKLMHTTYFALQDHSPEARSVFIKICKQYLSKHPGQIKFLIGPRNDFIKRDVSDLDFDVAMGILFKNVKAYDKYQKAKRHLEFIKKTENIPNTRRVFDSFVA